MPEPSGTTRLASQTSSRNRVFCWACIHELRIECYHLMVTGGVEELCAAAKRLAHGHTIYTHAKDRGRWTVFRRSLQFAVVKIQREFCPLLFHECFELAGKDCLVKLRSTLAANLG